MVNIAVEVPNEWWYETIIITSDWGKRKDIDQNSEQKLSISFEGTTIILSTSWVKMLLI